MASFVLSLRFRFASCLVVTENIRFRSLPLLIAAKR